MSNTPARPRYEWAEARYSAAGKHYPAAYGVVDHALGRFAPFTFPAGFEDAANVVARVASDPETFRFADAYTLTK
ncbi:hypothetical protein SEA_NIOBE_55 [Arthrobacter phage Niobe]|nr:hypothetical protein SEA_LONDON_55 [Arthrobacter phage London]UAJ15416.1 hypothetical protein SEA_ASA16_55 [Arthrobacter phage Asa16]